MNIVTGLAVVGVVALVAMSFEPAGARPPVDQDPPAQPPVLACRLGVLTSAERTHQKELRATLKRGTTGVIEDAEGLTFHFTAEIAPTTVIAWVERERRCCPFLRFTLDMSEDRGPSSLRVWGGPGVKAFLVMETKIGGSG